MAAKAASLGRIALIRSRIAEAGQAWLVLPGALLIGVVFIYPVLNVLALSFTDPPGLTHYEVFLGSIALVRILGRTLMTAAIVTVLALLVGYPFAYLAATTRPRLGHLLVGFIGGSLFVSPIVKSYTLLAILDRRGVINSLLEWLGLGSLRIELVHNFWGVVIGCLQFAIPLMVLPLYAVMRRFEHSYMHAAASLGARPVTAFFVVYVPMTSPGLIAGCSIVFVTTLGYYIVPSILGSPQNMMLGQAIAIQMQTILDWGLGTAMASTLLVAALLCFVVFHRLSRKYETNVHG